LGRETQKGIVLYLCLEEKRSEVKKHFAAMGGSGTNIFIHTGKAPEEALLELELAIAEYSPLLIIIDPLSRVLRVWDFNDYATMTRGLEPFVDLARKQNVHIQALHHDGKGGRNGGDAILGSTALYGSVDCHIQMKKNELGRVIATTNRYGVDLPETVIILDKETGLISVQGEVDAITQRQKQSEILDVISDGTALTEAEIKENCSGGAKGLVSKAIRQLVADGKLIRTGKGGKGSPFLYSRPV